MIFSSSLISWSHEQQYSHQDIYNQHNDVGQSVHIRSATRSSSVCMTLSPSLISSRAWTANIYLNVIVQLGRCKQIIQGLTYLTLKREIARFMGPTWGPSGADRTQVGPMLAPWTLLSGISTALWIIKVPYSIGEIYIKFQLQWNCEILMVSREVMLEIIYKKLKLEVNLKIFMVSTRSQIVLYWHRFIPHFNMKVTVRKISMANTINSYCSGLISIAKYTQQNWEILHMPMTLLSNVIFITQWQMKISSVTWSHQDNCWPLFVYASPCLLTTLLTMQGHLMLDGM